MTAPRDPTFRGPTEASTEGGAKPPELSPRLVRVGGLITEIVRLLDEEARARGLPLRTASQMKAQLCDAVDRAYAQLPDRPTPELLGSVDAILHQALRRSPKDS